MAKACLIETILKLLHQDLEAHFAGAVAGCNSLDLELVMEGRSDLVPLAPALRQMKAASDGVKLRINRGGILKDFFDAGMQHPTTTASPSGVLIASDTSFMSRVPGFWDTVVNTKKPGKISVACRTISSSPPAMASPSERRPAARRDNSSCWAASQGCAEGTRPATAN